MLFYVILVLLLENLHDRKIFWKAWLNIIWNFYQISCCEFGILDYPHKLVLTLQLLSKFIIDWLFYDFNRPVSHYFGLTSVFECFVEGLYYFDRHCESFAILFCDFQAVMEILAYSVIKSNLKIIDLHKFPPHYSSLSLPRGILGKCIPEGQQIKQLVVDSQILGLIVSHFLELGHFTLHVNEVSKLLNDLPNVILVHIQSINILHQLMKPVLFIP